MLKHFYGLDMFPCRGCTVRIRRSNNVKRHVIKNVLFAPRVIGPCGLTYISNHTRKDTPSEEAPTNLIFASLLNRGQLLTL